MTSLLLVSRTVSSYSPELECICCAVHGVVQIFTLEIEGKDLVVKRSTLI